MNFQEWMAPSRRRPQARPWLAVSELERRHTPTAISGHLWCDANGDGIRHPNEKGFEGVTVRMDMMTYVYMTGTMTHSTVYAVTDANGYYSLDLPDYLPPTSVVQTRHSFEGLATQAQGAAGPALVVPDAGFGPQNQGTDDAVDSEGGQYQGYTFVGAGGGPTPSKNFDVGVVLGPSWSIADSTSERLLWPSGWDPQDPGLQGAPTFAAANALPAPTITPTANRQTVNVIANLTGGLAQAQDYLNARGVQDFHGLTYAPSILDLMQQGASRHFVHTAVDIPKVGSTPLPQLGIVAGFFMSGHVISIPDYDGSIIQTAEALWTYTRHDGTTVTRVERQIEGFLATDFDLHTTRIGFETHLYQSIEFRVLLKVGAGKFTGGGATGVVEPWHTGPFRGVVDFTGPAVEYVLVAKLNQDGTFTHTGIFSVPPAPAAPNIMWSMLPEDGQDTAVVMPQNRGYKDLDVAERVQQGIPGSE